MPKDWRFAIEQRALREKLLHLKDNQGAPVYPRPLLEANLDVGYTLETDGFRHADRLGTRVQQYRKEDRAVFDQNEIPWLEPSQVIEDLVGEFRERLTAAYKDVMPWDGEV